MVSAYFSEQATDYDSLDQEDNSRSAYTSKINQLIAEDFKRESQIRNLLSVACGTGRRYLDIKAHSGVDFDIVGVDISDEMCGIAEQRGIDTICSTWLDANLESGQKFDAATILYAFGHVATTEDRMKSLKKIYECLNVGAALYLDVFNVNDKNEWGPQAVKFYEKRKLEKFGYDAGDVFYKKMEGSEIAFLHYFSVQEISELLISAGFRVEEVKHVGYVERAGEILNGEDEGALYIKAIKN